MFKNTSWPTVVAIIALVVSTASVYYQLRQSRFAHSVDLVLKLDDNFNSDRFIKLRKAAAKSIIDNTYNNVDDVIDFFDTMGMLVRRGAIDKEMVWHTFYYWIHNYSIATRKYIIEQSKKDSTVWEDFIELDKQVVALERSKGKGAIDEISRSEVKLKEFLEEESSL